MHRVSVRGFPRPADSLAVLPLLFLPVNLCWFLFFLRLPGFFRMAAFSLIVVRFEPFFFLISRRYPYLPFFRSLVLRFPSFA